MKHSWTQENQPQPRPDGPAPKPGRLNSPRAEAFLEGRRLRGTVDQERPFDPTRYRDIYAETD